MAGGVKMHGRSIKHIPGGAIGAKIGENFDYKFTITPVNMDLSESYIIYGIMSTNVTKYTTYCV